MSGAVLAIVAGLRELGFFADPSQSDAEIAAELAALYEAEWGIPLAPDDELAELEVARFDASRVWWEDTEADVGRGQDAYVELLEDLARISRGAFGPAQTEERWAGPQGPIHLRVALPDSVVNFEPRYLDDYLDVEGLLPQINATLAPDGPRFELYAPFDQTAAIVCLTPDERRRLEARGWSFADLGSG